jgi:hypothetical protein
MRVVGLNIHRVVAVAVTLDGANIDALGVSQRWSHWNRHRWIRYRATAAVATSMVLQDHSPWLASSRVAGSAP